MTRLTRRRAIVLAATSGVAGVAGCVGTLDELSGADDPGDGSLGSPASEVEISIVSQPTPAFEPNLVHVEVGGTVRWSVDGHRHDVTAYHPDAYGPQRIPDGAEPFMSGTLGGQSEFEWTFETEGIYDYVDTRALCATHEALGAVGRIIVGWPDLEGQPAIEHDTDELSGRATTVMDEIDERTRDVLGD